MEIKKENCDCLKGVCCDVKSCTHNKEEHCYASSIKVGPNFASCSNETICGTFKPKN